MSTATVSVIVSGAVGLAGVLFAFVNSRGERRQAQTLAEKEHEHQRLLARTVRLHDELIGAYREYLGLLYLLLDWMNSILLSWTLTPLEPMPPSPVTPEEIKRARARVSVIASEKVAQEMDDLDMLRLNFELKVALTKAQLAAEENRERVAEQFGEDAAMAYDIDGRSRGEVREEFDEARREFKKQVDVIEELARAEIRA